MITEKDWQEALDHWRPGVDHWGSCSMCRKFLATYNCEDCPLNIGDWTDREEDDGFCWHPEHPWRKWNDNPTGENAAKVYAFIAEKHEEWKKTHDRG